MIINFISNHLPMKTMKTFAFIFTFSLFLSACASFNALYKSPQIPKMMFVDLLSLQAGAQDSQVEEYFSRISPIVAKHGLKRVGSYKVVKKMKGTIEPDYINIWTVARTNTFKDIFSDPEYQKHVPFRNSTFDMQQANMFMLIPSYEKGKL